MPEPATATVLGDSIYALRFKEKTGPEVFFKLSGSDLDYADREKICLDLWQSYMNLNYLLTRERTKLNLREAGLSLATVLYTTLRNFKKLLPQGLLFNIDEKDGDYFFTVFASCDMNVGWYALEVGPVLQALAKKNRALHDLYLSFLRAFREYAGIDLWTDGMMGNTLEGLVDNLWGLADDPETANEYKKAEQFYKTGTPSVYNKLIRKAKKMTPAEIKRRAARFKAGEPISNLIYQGCDLLLPECSVYKFMYVPEIYNEDYYLSFDCLFNIVWENGDVLSGSHEEQVEAEANGCGVQEPTVYAIITPTTKKIDFQDLLKKRAWPNRLVNFLRDAFELTEKFKKNEQHHRNTAKKLPARSRDHRIRSRDK